MDLTSRPPCSLSLLTPPLPPPPPTRPSAPQLPTSPPPHLRASAPPPHLRAPAPPHASRAARTCSAAPARTRPWPMRSRPPPARPAYRASPQCSTSTPRPAPCTLPCALQCAPPHASLLCRTLLLLHATSVRSMLMGGFRGLRRSSSPPVPRPALPLSTSHAPLPTYLTSSTSPYLPTPAPISLTPNLTLFPSLSRAYPSAPLPVHPPATRARPSRAARGSSTTSRGRITWARANAAPRRPSRPRRRLA